MDGLPSVHTATRDVVVVGAGPVGLWAAAELRRSGLDVVVLERAETRDPRSRAVGMSASTIETFAMRGVAQRFLDAGIRISSSHFGASSTRLDLSALGTRYPLSLCIPQFITETLLADHCASLGVDVLYGHAVTSIAQHADGVDVAVHRSDGTTTTVRAGWAVGCDGTRSIVRAAAGIDFPGRDGGITGWLADVQLARAPAGPLGGATDTGSCLLQSIGNGLYRVAGVDVASMHLPSTQPPSLAEVQSWTTHILGDDFGMHSPVWTSRYGDTTRLAATFRRGRVLLAGDAAHQFFPAGGQGMNTGIQDATNLAWKLAGVIHGWAVPSVLDTYTAERRAASAAIIQNTNAQVALFAARTPSEIALREVFSEALAGRDLNRRWARRLTGFADPTPETLQTDTEPRVGQRITHLQLGDDPDALHLDMSAQRFLLVDMDGSLRTSILELARHWGAVLTIAGTRGVATSARWQHTRAILIRPDGIVAAVARHTDEPTNAQASLIRALEFWCHSPRRRRQDAVELAAP